MAEEIERKIRQNAGLIAEEMMTGSGEMPAGDAEEAEDGGEISAEGP